MCMRSHLQLIHEDDDADRRRRAERPRAKMPVADRHAVNGAPLVAPFPAGPRAGGVRARLFLGRRAEVLAAAGRLHDGRRLRRRLHEESDVRGGVLRTDRAHRGRARRVRSDEGDLRRAAARAFWENHDPTQGMRQGNDVGTQYRSAIYVYSDEQRAAAERSRDALRGRRSRAHGFTPITTEIRTRRRSTTPRTTTSSTSRRIPTATAGSAAPA